jgi:hypothetical protein
VRLLPETAPLAELGVDLAPSERLRFGLGAFASLPQRIHYLNGHTDLQLTSAYLRGCARVLSLPSVSVWWCAAPMLGLFTGIGHGYDHTYSKRLVWSALGTGAQLEGALAYPAFWSLSASAVLPLSSRGFAIRSGDQRHELLPAPRLAFVSRLGMGVWF